MNLAQMMDVLLAALVVELRADGTDTDLCSTTLMPGDSVAIDYSECGGMAWVRLIDSYPTSGGVQTGLAAGACYWHLAHNVEIGVMRPGPFPAEILQEMELPSDEDHAAAAHLQYRDVEAMNRAIIAAKREIEELVPVGYTPAGPAGGAVGGSFQITIGDA